VLDLVLFDTALALLVTPACGIAVETSMARQERRSQIPDRDEIDAVHRTRGQAQLASGALVCDHGVHYLRRPDDGIDGAGLDAQRAADAVGFVDARDQRSLVFAPRRIERQRRRSGACRKLAYDPIAARRASVDGRIPGRHGFSVRAATIEAALPALRLGQLRIEKNGQRCRLPSQAKRSDENRH
jgi:hypothetical protein